MIYYSGNLISFFTLALIGDFFRNKTLLIGGLLMTIFGTLILAFSDILELAVVGMWFMTFGTTFPLNLSYIFMTEMVDEDKRQKYKIIMVTTFNLSALFVVGLFYVLPDFKLVLIYFIAIPYAVITAIFFFFIEDTPMSLVTKGSH